MNIDDHVTKPSPTYDRPHILEKFKMIPRRTFLRRRCTYSSATPDSHNRSRVDVCSISQRCAVAIPSVCLSVYHTLVLCQNATSSLTSLHLAVRVQNVQLT